MSLRSLSARELAPAVLLLRLKKDRLPASFWLMLSLLPAVAASVPLPASAARGGASAIVGPRVWACSVG